MPKLTVADWDTSQGNNTDIGGVNINEGCPPSGINNAIREVMAQLATAGIGFMARLNVAQVFTKPQRSSVTALTSATTITITLASSNDYTLTLGHNATLANPSDIATYIGQKGSIRGQQDATGSRTLAVGSVWFPIGSAVVPGLPTAANAKWRLDYDVVSATRIDFALQSVG